MEDNSSTDGVGGWGLVQAVMRAMGSDGRAIEEVSLAGPLLTSCREARLLTGLGAGDPCSKQQPEWSC